MKVLAAVVSLLAWAVPQTALAQIAPGDTGAGEVRGIRDLGNSGQVGTATFYALPKGTRVVVRVRGMRPGRIEPLAIIRGTSCDELKPVVGWTLQPLIKGQSSTTVTAPTSKLLSGNYNVVAHADDHVPGHNVACGELYQ